MKALVICDSIYGNTGALAIAIGETIGGGTRVARAADVNLSDLEAIDLLIVGSPTHGGRPTPATLQFLRSIPRDTLAKTDAAAFDTRLAEADQAFWLRILIKATGYAAPRIAAGLRAGGARLALPPEGFIVEGKEGPLRQGELERARSWAAAILRAAALTEPRAASTGEPKATPSGGADRRRPNSSTG